MTKHTASAAGGAMPGEGQKTRREALPFLARSTARASAVSMIPVTAAIAAPRRRVLRSLSTFSKATVFVRLGVQLHGCRDGMAGPLLRLGVFPPAAGGYGALHRAKIARRDVVGRGLIDAAEREPGLRRDHRFGAPLLKVARVALWNPHRITISSRYIRSC